MGRSSWAAVAAILAVAAPTFAGFTGSAAPGSFANPGFETDSDLDGVPDGWTVAGTTTARAARSAGVARGGLFSLLLADADPSGRVTVTSPALAVAPGESLTVGVWARGDGGSTVSSGALELEVRVSGTTQWIARTPTPALGASWSRVGVDVVVPFGAHSLTLAVRTGVEARGVYHVDEAFVATRADPPGGLVSNPSFALAGEVDADAGFWRSQCEFGATAARASPGRTDAHHLKLAPGEWSACVAYSHPFPVHPRGSVSGELWTSADAFFEHHVEFRDASHAVLDETRGPQSLSYPAPTWARALHAGCAPSNTAYAVVRLGMDFYRNADVRYDDARVTASPALCNLVPEPGFERSVPPVGWTYRAHCPPTPVADGRTGQGLRLSDSMPDVCKASFSKYVPRDELTASAWARATGGAARLSLEFVDEERRVLLERDATTTVEGEWQRLVVTGTAPAGTSYVSLVLASPHTGFGVADFDDAGLAYGPDPVT